MIKDKLHEHICNNYEDVQNWFKAKSKNLAFPFYSSYDLREANYKVAPVDANIFPAGFNNICQVDKDSAIEKVKNYFQDHYPKVSGAVALVTEAHTKNAYYWQNIITISGFLKEAGLEVKVAIPSENKADSIQVDSISGEAVTVNFIYKENGVLKIDGEAPEILISNNDFSVIFENWLDGFEQPMNPPHELGWYQRKKSSFFEQYNLLSKEFSQLIGLDSHYLTVATKSYKGFDINSEESRNNLAIEVDKLLLELKENYQKQGVDEQPFVFIKNSSGTYGLGIQQVSSGEEVKNWSYKSRKKMKAVKGGGSIEELILQEGIPTVYRTETETAEPAIYMIGDKLAGGFLRAHSKKGPKDNLNSPGAIYKKLCISDLKLRTPDCPMENVYGWVAKLGSLAVAQEASAAGISFKNYSS